MMMVTPPPFLPFLAPRLGLGVNDAEKPVLAPAGQVAPVGLPGEG